ncbi:MAG: beta-lactamase family protein [Bacteroidales bacterium]|jgi:CubicO group peptidase (beta-lactamase class C family)|nr:beta-lactamase family protein [Bacteroidales bacterium]
MNAKFYKFIQHIIHMPTRQKILILLAIAGCFTLYANLNREQKNKNADHFTAKIETAIDSTKYKQIDKILTDAFNEGRFNGHVIYAEKGKILYNSTFGYEDLKTKKPLTDTSIFQLASTSKPFTAIAILKLHQEKKLDINQPVIFYLPDFPYKNVTIKHLLQHRSGLPNYMNLSHKNWDYSKSMTNNDLTPLLKKTKARLQFNPDSRFQYSNTNYAYLANIVEKASKQSFHEYMDTEIFQPLGMYNTYVYSHDKRHTYNAVKGYDFNQKRGFYERKADYLDGVAGDKGIFSTANDLFLFDQALHNHEIISKDLLDLAFTPAKPFDEKHNRDYGLGFRLKLDDNNLPVAYHHGWWRGFRTYFIHDYHNQRTLIWLNNRSDVQIAAFMGAILEQTGLSDEEQLALGGGEN